MLVPCLWVATGGFDLRRSGKPGSGSTALNRLWSGPIAELITQMEINNVMAAS
jgi:hypothetical protein